MENNNMQNPFADEKPQIVHFEKDQSHYEYCRVKMHEIERAHCRTFVGNLILCILVCVLGIFQQYIGGFCLVAKPDHWTHSAFFALGVFQIVTAFIVIILGYLAWANIGSLNIILAAWYLIVTIIGIYRSDYLTAVVGVVGVVLYVFAMRAMSEEQRLSEMEGYPNFVEKFDVAQSDIVIQTLLAHKGEKRTKSTLFTTDYSLRRKKKKNELFPVQEKQPESGAESLAVELQKRLDGLRDAKTEEKTETSAAAPEQKPSAQTFLAVKDCEIGIAAQSPDGGAQIVYSEQIAKGARITVTDEQVLIDGVPSTPVTHFRAGRYADVSYRTRFDESEDYLAENLKPAEAEEAQAEAEPAQPEMVSLEDDLKPAEAEAVTKEASAETANEEAKPAEAPKKQAAPQNGANPQRKKNRRR